METIKVRLVTRTGGVLEGLVVDHSDHGIVIVHKRTPYVFAWDELEPGSAVVTMRALLAHARGSAERLTARDHFELGCFALKRGGNLAAGAEFSKARALDPGMEDSIRAALDEYRRGQSRASDQFNTPADDLAESGSPEAAMPGLLVRMTSEVVHAGVTNDAVVPPSTEISARILGIYKSFGETVRETISKNIVLLETDHFLIWTDWDRRDHARLGGWCESMYAALCDQFGLSRDKPVFLAKCPIFCFQSKARFRKFAQSFDGYDGRNAIGYSRSIAENGHVHLALLRTGSSEADFDRLASTLVHEGTHAFLHRLHSTRLIPHWVNEGYADLMAEQVLGDRCPNGENAALLARQYVRYDWPVHELLHGVGPIAVHEYPLAHSVVAYLHGRSAESFAAFIKSLKEGESVTDALAAHYDGMTPDELEAHWRAAIQAHEPVKDRWQP